jgi:hypothetical protein
MKYQLVPPRGKIRSLQQRRIAPAITICGDRQKQVPVRLITAIKINYKTGRRHASSGIQNMCGQTTHLNKLP